MPRPHSPDLQLAALPRGQRHPLVLVEWLDAWFDDDQEGPEDARDDYPVRTVGFLLRTGSVVSIAQEILPDGEGFRAVTHIPGGMVTRIRALETGEELQSVESAQEA